MANRSRNAVLHDVRTLLSVGSVGRMTDEQLLERFLSRDEDGAESAFEALVLRHGPMVLGVCRCVLKDRHDTEDAFQATFLILVRRANSIRRRDLLGPWLYGVARRVAMRAKANAVHRHVCERQTAERALPSYATDEARHDDFAVLHEEIARLPDKYRAPVVLCYLEGMTYETAAHSLHLTESTLRGRLARGRERLRTRLIRRGLTVSAGLAVIFDSREVWAMVPPSLVDRTAQAAVGLVAGKMAATGAVATSVYALAEGVLKTMFHFRLKAIISVLMATGVLVIGASVCAQQDVNSQLGAGEGSEPALIGPAITTATGAGPQDDGKRNEIDEELAKLFPGRIIRSREITKDCMVLSYLPDWSHGDVDNIGIADNNGGVRTLLNWPEIDPKVISSGLRFLLALYSRKTTARGSPGPIHAFVLRGDWPERTSWKTLPDYDPEPSATFPFSTGDGWKVFDITPIVQAEPKGGRKANGLMLRFLSEDRSGSKKNWSGYQLVSREGEGEWANRRPLLLLVEPTKK